MHAAAIAVALAALGVDVGWGPLDDGGFAYTIQIEPDVLESLRAGEVEVQSDVPRAMRDVRTFCVQVGKERLPQQGRPPLYNRATAPAGQPATDPRTAGWRPLAEGGYEYIVQVPAAAWAAFAAGEPTYRDLPAELHDIRSVIVIAGDDPLPQEGPEAAGAAAATDRSTTQPTAAGPTFLDEEEEEPTIGGTSALDAADEESDLGPRYPSRLDERPTLEAPGSNTAADEEDRDFGSDRASGSDRERPSLFADDRTTDDEFDDGDEDRSSRDRRGSSFDEDESDAFGDRRSADDDELDRDSGRQTRAARLTLDEEDDSPSDRLRGRGGDDEEEPSAVAYTLLVLALFASLGANAYLGFVLWEFRGRYLRNVDEFKGRHSYARREEEPATSLDRV
jgi:hypothetical protein